jgi:asparagine synthase (glutamine-hydrolysing)
MAQVSSHPVNTFAVVFDEKEYDESHYSNLISKKYHTHHTPILLHPKDFLQALPDALLAMDTPSGDGVNTYVVSKATKQAGITVALSGLGGDELFAGYPVFKQWMRLQKYQVLWSVPDFIRKPIGVLAAAIQNDNKGSRLQELIGVKDAEFSTIYPTFRKLMVEKELLNLMPKAKGLYENIPHSLLQSRKSALHQLPALSQVSVGELLTYTLNVLIKDTDQMSMASALEVREPFFDYKLVEFVLQIPDSVKYPTYAKQLLVESLSPLIPDEVVHRKKMGFVFPWEHWMRNELKSFCESQLLYLSTLSLFDNKELMTYWQRFLAKDKKILWAHLWQIVVLSHWLQQHQIEQ